MAKHKKGGKHKGMAAHLEGFKKAKKSKKSAGKKHHKRSRK